MITRDPVPVELWGKDHWSTLAYIETCCVDGKGKVVNDRMRTDQDRHPALVGHRVAMLSTSSLYDDTTYPTRLKGEQSLEDHDDWDCATDMEAAGLLKWEGTGMHPIFVLTEMGIQLCAQLRKHKATGGYFANFSPQPPRAS